LAYGFDFDFWFLGVAGGRTVTGATAQDLKTALDLAHDLRYF
jgi:hypothetical protein